MILSFIVFGVIDNLIMWKTGEELEKHIERHVLRITRGKYKLREGSKVSFLCAAIGNALSDMVGGLCGLNIYLAVCSFIGCMIIAIIIARRTFVRVS